jgi:hypothetical protein
MTLYHAISFFAAGVMLGHFYFHSDTLGLLIGFAAAGVWGLLFGRK